MVEARGPGRGYEGRLAGRAAGGLIVRRGRGRGPAIEGAGRSRNVEEEDDPMRGIGAGAIALDLDIVRPGAGVGIEDRFRLAVDLKCRVAGATTTGGERKSNVSQ